MKKMGWGLLQTASTFDAIQWWWCPRRTSWHLVTVTRGADGERIGGVEYLQHDSSRSFHWIEGTDSFNTELFDKLNGLKSILQCPTSTEKC